MRHVGTSIPRMYLTAIERHGQHIPRAFPPNEVSNARSTSYPHNVHSFQPHFLSSQRGEWIQRSPHLILIFSKLQFNIAAPYRTMNSKLTAPTAKPVLIIGAGISGLSTARLLTKHNISVIVFEQSSPERSQGYSITIRDWAYKPLLSDLGNTCVGDLERAVAVDRSLGGCGWIDLTLRDTSTGVTLLAPQPSKPDETEQALFRANRTALRSWLSEGVDLRYEHKLKSFEGKAGDVKAIFESGIEVEGSLIVGADGLHSTGTFSSYIKHQCLYYSQFHSSPYPLTSHQTRLAPCCCLPRGRLHDAPPI